MDKIIIRGLKVFAHHGVNPEETATGQQFLVDVTASADLSLLIRNRFSAGAGTRPASVA